jgi:hypothetical protein
MPVSPLWTVDDLPISRLLIRTASLLAEFDPEPAFDHCLGGNIPPSQSFGPSMPNPGIIPMHGGCSWEMVSAALMVSGLGSREPKTAPRRGKPVLLPRDKLRGRLLNGEPPVRVRSGAPPTSAKEGVALGDARRLLIVRGRSPSSHCILSAASVPGGSMEPCHLPDERTTSPPVERVALFADPARVPVHSSPGRSRLRPTCAATGERVEARRFAPRRDALFLLLGRERRRDLVAGRRPPSAETRDHPCSREPESREIEVHACSIVSTIPARSKTSRMADRVAFSRSSSDGSASNPHCIGSAITGPW